MVVTTTEILTVNGVVLNTLAKNVESIAGRLRVPAFRTGNVVVPGSHGAVRTPNKRFDSNLVTLPMWVIGCNDDGAIPTGSTARREFFARIAELTKLFKGSSAALDIQHTLPSGLVVQTFGDALDAFDFSVDQSPKGLFTVNIDQYYPAWQDLNSSTQGLAAAGVSVVATTFAAATFPMEDLVMQMRGPWTNPRLDFADGSWFAWDGIIPANITMALDNGAFTLAAEGAPTSWVGTDGATHTVSEPTLAVTAGPSVGLGGGARTAYWPRTDTFVYADGSVLTAGKGWSFDIRRVRHDGGDGVWAALPASSQQIKLSGTGRTSDTRLALTGRRPYLVG